MVVKGYILMDSNDLEHSGEYSKYLDLFLKMDDMGIKRTTLFFTQDAIYFEKDEEISVLVVAQKNTVGMAKLYAKKLIKSKKKRKIKLDSLDEIFKLAEEIDKMSLVELVKTSRR